MQASPTGLHFSDFTYGAMWWGFVYLAFVIDVFACQIVDLRASHTASAGFFLDALEQAVYKSRASQDKLVHHSDRGLQYLSIKYIERLVKAKIAPSVGSGADPYSSQACCACSGGQRTTPWPRRSVACSKPKSFTAVAPGAALKLSNMPRSNGSNTALSNKHFG
jgi:putative transposase